MPKDYPTIEDKRAVLRKRLDQWIDIAGDDALVQPIANAMFAGPCKGCLEMASKEWLAVEMPLMPLDECPRPDQCVGYYTAVLRFE